MNSTRLSFAELRQQAIALRRAGKSRREIPKTVRKNVGDDYHGCLCVRIRQGAELYQKVEGWARAAMSAGPGCEPVRQLADSRTCCGASEEASRPVS